MTSQFEPAARFAHDYKTLNKSPLALLAVRPDSNLSAGARDIESVLREHPNWADAWFDFSASRSHDPWPRWSLTKDNWVDGGPDRRPRLIRYTRDMDLSDPPEGRFFDDP